MEDTPRLNTADLSHTVRTFICVAHKHHSAVEGRISKLGFHHSQHRMLMHLARYEHIPSQKELADALGVTPAAVTTTLKRLEKDGYITRTATEDDNRCNRIRITPEGLEVIKQSRDIFNSVDEQMFDGLTPEEISVFTSLLCRMRENLTDDGSNS